MDMNIFFRFSSVVWLFVSLSEIRTFGMVGNGGRDKALSSMTNTSIIYH